MISRFFTKYLDTNSIRFLYITYTAILGLYLCALYLFSDGGERLDKNIQCLLLLESVFTLGLALSIKKVSFFIYSFFLIFFVVEIIKQTASFYSPAPWLMILLFIPRAYITVFSKTGNTNLCQLNLVAFITIIILQNLRDIISSDLVIVFAYLGIYLLLIHIFITKDFGISNLINFIDNTEKNRIDKAKKAAKLNKKNAVVLKENIVIRAFNYLDVLFHLLFALLFLKYWLMPEQDDISTIYYLCILMGFEFIMVHSGVFMSVMKTSWSIFVFFPAYGLFALCFTAMVGDMSILWLYLIVVFNRMRFAFFAKDEETKIQNIRFSTIALVTYFFLIFACVFTAGIIPEFGLNQAFLDEVNYASIINTGGMLTEIPNMSMCLGFSYYGLLALWGFLIIRSNNKKTKLD